MSPHCEKQSLRSTVTVIHFEMGTCDLCSQSYLSIHPKLLLTCCVYYKINKLDVLHTSVLPVSALNEQNECHDSFALWDWLYMITKDVKQTINICLPSVSRLRVSTCIAMLVIHPTAPESQIKSISCLDTHLSTGAVRPREKYTSSQFKEDDGEPLVSNSEWLESSDGSAQD